jgi:iron complex outermembrane recepter protein
MSRYRFSTSVSVLGLLIGCPVFANEALAQQAPAADTTDAKAETGEILVTANRREQSTIEVPMAVTAISADELNSKGLTQIEDFVGEVPGFAIQNVGNSGLRLILRGQNTGGAGASVATIVDDVVLSSPLATFNGSILTANLETFDMERVEVLRGPQGTLYGATAQGGLLKYVTRKPNLEEAEGNFELGIRNVRLGAFGWSAKGAVSAPLIVDKVAVRAMAYYNDVPGFIDNPLLGKKDIDGGESYGGRVMLLVEPVENLSLLFTAAYQRQSFSAIGTAEIVGAPITPQITPANAFDLLPAASATGPSSRERFEGALGNELQYYNAVLTYDFGGAELVASTSIAKFYNQRYNDITDSPAAPGLPIGNAFAGAFGLPGVVVGLRQDESFKKFNQEIRLASTDDLNLGGVNLSWLIGAYYSDEKVRFTQVLDAFDPSNLSNAITVLPFIPNIGGTPLGGSALPASYKEISGFADVTLKLSDRFEISVGGRYSNNKQELAVTNFPGLLNGINVTRVNPIQRSSENKFTWSVAPRFALSNDISIYTRIATGYRPGGPVSPIPGAPADLPQFYESDTTTNYEVGAKGNIADGLLKFDVAAFVIDWKNIQLVTRITSVTTGQAFNLTGNGGEARSSGIEWAFDLQPADGLVLGWTGAYTNARLTTDATTLGGFSGDDLPYVPKFSSNVSLDYTFELNEQTSLYAGANWNHISQRFGGFSLNPAATNNPLIPGYDTIDLRLGADIKNFGLQLFVRNLTDERGLTNYENSAAFNVTGGRANFITPRTVGLRFTASY